MRNIPQLLPQERMLSHRTGRHGQQLLLRTEQKNLSCSKDVRQMFSTTCYRVVKFYDRTFSTVKACMLFPDQQCLVGCDIEAECAAWEEESLIETCIQGRF